MSRSIEAVKAMREEGISARAAAKRFGISPQSVSKARRHPNNRTKITELTKQRDELLTACEGLLKAHRITLSKRPPDTVQAAEKQLDAITEAVCAAEAAIARVKGGV